MHIQPIEHWLFTRTDDPDAWAKRYDDADWRTVVVPHDWSVEEEFAESFSSGTGYLPGGIGWYRAHIPAGGFALREDSVVRLVFHGVYKKADVWVNGYHVGGRPSGHSRFSFDLTEILSYSHDDELVISVRVDHTDISDSRWYNGSGITRRVEIEVHDAVHLREHGTVVTTLRADAGEATIRVDQALVNSSAAPAEVHARHELTSLSTGRVHTADTQADLAAGGSATTSATIRVSDPELWSDGDPRLHRLVTTLTWPGGSAEYSEIVGIRTFRFDPDHGFSINGERRTLKGVCLHEDAGTLGTAVPAEVWLRRLLALKEMGCNAIRMAHNPHAPELYALCDALGFYVIDEAFDEWENAKNKWWQGHNVYPPRHQGYASDFTEWHERDLVAMVEAGRNRPSIIAWSIGNEIDYPNDPYASPLFDEMTGNNDANKPAAERVYDPTRPDIRRLTTIATELARIVRASDPTRPVTLAAAFPELSSRTGLLEPLDVVGYNYKEHLYEDDHRRFPAKPLLGSENSHEYPDWQAVTRNDFIAGQFLWTGIDYLGEAYGWPIHGAGAGQLTLAGFPKQTWHLRRSWWSDEPVARIVVRPHVEGETEFWSHPVSRTVDFAEAGPTEVLCFANGDAVQLSAGGAPVETAWDDEHGYWRAVVPALTGPLELEVLRDGAVIATDRIESAGEPARLDAVVWEAPEGPVALVRAAGLPAARVVQIECTLRDSRGSEARGEVLVEASVEGGELLGLENGDLADVTAYALPQRRTLDGRLIVFVLCDGPASVRLRAEGLEDALVVIE
ncbi:glycoside hydrolase family 2 TIM barrel-domain containing protein [Microbacterium sp. SD291]|uniref:glycoside hydrolase family 2 TIM barrel-domain containing protein n=1 Tax=Microbacterium sp. SD291 TaxID=2782007 RepID=UPI001A96D418|nr:glycoside hydrolase family 2 TIM barrel-domain containing protein [Microbacterium sp. SD291]MBO0981689.1 beta-galactosidase [Microbacterium sp. SD291]